MVFVVTNRLFFIITYGLCLLCRFMNPNIAIGNTTGNEVAPGKGSLGNTGKDLGKINIMMIPAGNINTVQGNILVQEERKYGNLLGRNAPATISKGDQADGKWHRKRKENDQDTEKFREIPGRCHQVCLLFCSRKMSSRLSAFLFFPPSSLFSFFFLLNYPQEGHLIKQK